MKIFKNKFKPINLYQLQHMQDFTFKANKDKEKISIEDGMLKLQKILGIYKDYGSSLYKVWSEFFINYTSIMVFLFGAMVPCL